MNRIELFKSRCAANNYNFYHDEDFDDNDRIELLGQWLFESRDTLQLQPQLVVYMGDAWNYGHRFGLLTLTAPVYMLSKDWENYKGNPHWFKIGAFSPDDLDCDLVFNLGWGPVYNSQHDVVTEYWSVREFITKNTSMFTYGESYFDMLTRLNRFFPQAELQA